MVAAKGIHSQLGWGTRYCARSFILISTLLFASVAADDRTEQLSSQVTIRRDTFGVPHILAETEEAAAFGQGYAVAEDHVLELARLFLKARSEEAAYFGERFADSDLAAKELGMYDGAETGYRTLPPWVQMILAGYAAGYNRYVVQHRSELPDWVRPCTGTDVLAHARRVILMEFSMDLRQLRDIRRGAQQSNADLARHEWIGSNMWAIGKGRSESGRGILLGNPHLRWSGSQLFHELHITVPGKLNFSGTSLIGSPGLAIGFNEYLGWSHTVNPHDSDDIYELTLDPDDNERYMYEGHLLPLQKREISIQVKAATGMATRTKTAYYSHYGPILARDGKRVFAFKSPNLDECRFVEQWNLMTKARNLTEFRQALDMQAIPMFNICYADREGNVFYIWNGRFPDRPAGYNWSGVVPGNSAATEWNRILPASRLPQLLNPPGSYVQNCNSAPWYANLHAIIDRHNFPEFLCPNMNDLRQQLSLEMLESDESITLDEVLRYKYNTRLLLADRVKPDVLKLARGQAGAAMNLDAAANVLEGWDNTVARESKGGMLFVTFWNKYRDQAKPVFAVPWDENRPGSTPQGIGDEETAVKALAAAVKELNEKYGSLEIAWGDVHRLRRGDVDVPIGGLTGDYGAFRVVGYEAEQDGKFVARGGDSYVLAVEFTTPPTAYSVVAYSQTDDPKSPHHTDQSRLFAAEQWKRAWFTEEDVAKNTERTYHP
jgi:acyl-homoserine-lactone acylase